MPKNIVIFSDGTGQRGGRYVDEERTNIYKMYRATRCGPDTTIDPLTQLTFYDPGLGTQEEGAGLAGTWNRLINMISKATGMGITSNIIDCYAAILAMWEPGDRILLLGFSRGAYTVRCLAAALSLCGVPTKNQRGGPLRKDPSSLRKIAKEAVTEVYQHVGSPKDKKHIPQRKALAERFRSRYSSEDDGESNAHPYFVGVYDTVASLGNYFLFAMLALACLIIIGGLSWLLARLLPGFGYGTWFLLVAAVAAFLGSYSYLKTHLRWSTELENYSFWDTLHLNAPRMRFYDQQLNENVSYARHAISIDEDRIDFQRVPWGNTGSEVNYGLANPMWFKQYWFAGNHSDVGGGFPENESRLSDIALQWMIVESTNLPCPLLINHHLLKPFPSACGMQHDAMKSTIFRFRKRTGRNPVPDATLHPSVLSRFECGDVLHYDIMKLYRPDELKNHQQLKDFYP